MRFFLLVIMCGILTYDILPAQDKYFKRTIYQDEIKHAGIARPSDLVLLIDEVTYFSIDGYTYQGSINQLDHYQQQNWIIMVDGQQLNLKLFDITNLNLLPFSTDQIDSIEVCLYPQQHADEFTNKGLIHIHRKKVAPGVSVRAQFTAGNTTGDPGPYRYTKYWSENVDRIAADDSYWLSYKGQAGYLGVGYYSQVYYPTDNRIRDRNKQIYPYGNPVITTNSYSMRAGLDKIISQPTLSVFHARLDDMYFFKPLGREIPTKNYFSHIGINGEEKVHQETSIGYKFFYSLNRLDKRNNVYDMNFNWQEEKLYFNIYSIFHQSADPLKIGIGMERSKVNTDYKIGKNIIYSGKIYADLNLKNTAITQQKVNLSVLYDGDSWDFNSAVSGRWKLNNGNFIFGTISYSHIRASVESTIWYWSENGYDFVKDNGGFYSIRDNLHPGKIFTTDLKWLQRGRILPDIEIDMFYRYFQKKNLESQTFQYDSNTRTVSGPVLIQSTSGKSVGGVTFKLKYTSLKSLNHELYYNYTILLMGKLSLNSLWQATPEHRLSYRLIFTPVESFSIWAKCQYISETYWIDYKNIDDENENVYSAKTPSVFLVDMAVNKWLWNRRIKVDLILRNLFNQNHIMHPIGAALDLRFYAQAVFYFNFQ